MGSAAGEDGIQFELKPLPTTDSKQERYRATYRAEPTIAQFEIEFQTLRASAHAGVGIESGKGALISIPGSQPARFVLDLCRALQARPCPQIPSERVSRLNFDFAILGRNAHRETKSGKEIIGGGFSLGIGNWIPMKIFVGEGDDQGEVFLNLNPKDGIGEFSIKDPDYGVPVMKALVTVL